MGSFWEAFWLHFSVFFAPGSLLDASWHEKHGFSGNSIKTNRKSIKMPPGRPPKRARIVPSRFPEATFSVLNFDPVLGSILAPFWLPKWLPFGTLWATKTDQNRKKSDKKMDRKSDCSKSRSKIGPRPPQTPPRSPQGPPRPPQEAPSGRFGAIFGPFWTIFLTKSKGIRATRAGSIDR